MSTRTKWCPRSIIGWLLVILLLNLTVTTMIVLADGWKANDDGNDDPDSTHWWFAPFSVQHQMAWWDVDQAGAMDQVLDHHMQWENDVQDWFNNQPDRNLCHEVRTGRSVYEANDWYWTDLPQPDHNEDSNELEELADGYEEKEIGWDQPSTQIPEGVEKTVYTGFNSLNNGDTYFESEAELCMPSPFTGDPWYPERWDVLGRMQIQGAD